MRVLIAFALIAAATAWPELPDCGVSRHPDAGDDRSLDEVSINIVGGWQTLEDEFPYMATMKTSTGSFFCGGTIISARSVLTAAHCTSGRTPSSTRVGLGEWQLSTGANYILATVSAINQHPGYSSSTMANDVSVVVVTNTIEFNDGRRPVCPSERSGNADSYAGQRLIVSGWGTTSEGGSVAQIMRAVDVAGYTLVDCRATNYPPSWVLEGMICAGYPEGGKDACQGDSGGSLVYKRNGEKFEMVGIVSWGQGCGRPGFPGIYADAVYYKGWISDNML